MFVLTNPRFSIGTPSVFHWYSIGIHCAPRRRVGQWKPMETMGSMRPMETTGTNGYQWETMRPRGTTETNGYQWEPMRPRGTTGTNGKQWEPMRPRGTNENQWEPMGNNGTMGTKGNQWETHATCNVNCEAPISSLWFPLVPICYSVIRIGLRVRIGRIGIVLFG